MLKDRAARWAGLASAALFLLGALVWAAVPVAAAAVFGDGAARVIAVGFAAAVGLLAVGAALRRRAAAGLALALAAALVWHFGARAFVAPRLAPLTLSHRVAGAIPAEARPTAVVGYAEPSFVFHMRGQVAPMTPEEALAAAAADRYPGYAVPQDLADPLTRAIAAAGGCPRAVGSAAGLNYSNGDTIALTVIAARCQDAASAAGP